MTEVSAGLKREISADLEVPKNTVQVILPPVDIGSEYTRQGVIVRLGMHTDSILTLLKTLNSIPDSDQLKIEGRVLTEDQRRALLDSQTYQFFLQSRFQRGQIVAPSFLRLTPEAVAALVQSNFSPSSLQEEIGHKTGYFNARDLVDEWIETGTPNILLPIVGGINEFSIGSNTLVPGRLLKIADVLDQAFQDQELTVALLGVATIAKTTGFTNYKLNNLPLLSFKNYQKIDLSKTIKSKIFDTYKVMRMY